MHLYSVKCIHLYFHRDIRHENQHYDAEEILARSIQNQNDIDRNLKRDANQKNRQYSLERYRSHSSFSERYYCRCILHGCTFKIIKMFIPL